MEEITITQQGFNERYMSYLYGKVRERFSFLPSTCQLRKQGDLCSVEFQTEPAYSPYVRKFAEENIADVIAIGYKYAFFEKNLSLPLLNSREKRILFTALVAADYREDKAYALKRLHGFNKYCLDGVFHFRLRELKQRWEGIAEYVSPDLGKASLESFLEFLTEDGVGKIFVKDGKVYDDEYRLLSRSTLTGNGDTVEEILLGGAERVYCFGKTDEQTAAFLKKYYPAKAIFC